MGLDSYAAIPRVEHGNRLTDSNLPGRVVSARTLIDQSGDPYTVTKRVAFGFEQVPPMLGGMFSGCGSDGSFRGKCYAALVERVTGFSLYEDELPPPVVALMAEKLRSASDASPLEAEAQEVFEQLSQSDDPELAERYDLYCLAAFFEAAAGRGYSVVSWY